LKLLQLSFVIFSDVEALLQVGELVSFARKNEECQEREDRILVEE